MRNVVRIVHLLYSFSVVIGVASIFRFSFLHHGKGLLCVLLHTVQVSFVLVERLPNASLLLELLIVAFHLLQ